jgi:hypothetical protein
MPLKTTLITLFDSLDEITQVASDAHQWTSLNWTELTLPINTPRFLKQHNEWLIQMSFFKGFLAWEKFLEESFIHYLLGETAPNSTPLLRYAIPLDRTHAEKFASEGKKYPDWTDIVKIINRATLFFKLGGPYPTALQSQQAKLQDIKTIRNAIAHSSTYSKQKFQSLVRRELGNCPHDLTIGGFLTMTKPNTSPPESFFESYVNILRFLANEIVPTSQKKMDFNTN